MLKTDYIAVIYNPNSTGSSTSDAEELKKRLEQNRRAAPVELIATKHAGHAIELGYQLAKAHGSPLLISSSGDGGFHEMINGAMRAQAEGAQPICAVLPAGNANDHARTMQHKPLAELIKNGKTKKLDLLRLVASGPEDKQLYAHSYIGLGLTPIIATELNKNDLNSWIEGWTVVKNFWSARPVTLRVSHKIQKYDSLVCSTIPEMAKVLKLAKDAKPDDGKFEITSFAHNRKTVLIYRLLRRTIVRPPAQKQVKSFSFELVKETPIQLDGEVHTLAKNSKVTIFAEKQILRTLV